MSYGQIIAAGEVDSGSTITLTSRTTCWMIVQHQSNSEIIATFDGKYPVHLSKDLTAYVKVPEIIRQLLSLVMAKCIILFLVN